MKNKTKKINPVRNKTPWASVYAFAHRISNGIKIFQKIGATGAMLFLVFLFFANTASAAPDSTIYYQGKLTDTTDVAVADAGYNFKFRIYDAATNGNCLWSARGTCGTPTAKSVTVSKGVFSTELGDASDNALNLDFNSNYWLEVTVGTDTAMDPRKKINAAGYALNSAKLNGQADTAFALLAGRAGGQIFRGGTASGDDLTFQTTSDGAKGSYVFSELGSGLVLSTAGTLSAVTNTLHAQNTDTGTTGVSFVVGSATDSTTTDTFIQFGSTGPETLTFDGDTTDNFLLSDDLVVSGGLTATTINGNTFTTGTGTITLAAGKTLTANNTLTFTGTDSSSVAFGTGGTVAYTGGTLGQFASTTSAQLSGVLSDENTSGGYMTNVMTTAGDLIYAGASGVPARLGEGTNDAYVLKINTTTHIPYWSTDLQGSSHTQNTDTGTTGVSFIVGSATDSAATNTTLQFGSANVESLIFQGASTDNFVLSDDLDITGGLTTTTSMTAGTTITAGLVATYDPITISPVAKGAGAFTGTISSLDLTGAHAWNFPNADGTVALTANKLSVFAATTSAELSGVLSDENTSGGYMTDVMTTAGDLIYAGASGVPARLGEGTNDAYVLKINTTTHIPYWSADLQGGGHTQNTDTGTTGVSFIVGSATNSTTTDTFLQFGSTGPETLTFDGDNTDNFLLSDDLVVSGGLTATTINGNTFTTGTGTLTLGAGKTLTSSNTLILTATDGSTLAIGAGGTLGSAAYTASTAYLASGNSTQLGYFNDIYLDDTNASNHMIINYGSDVASDFTLGLLMTASYNLTIAGTASVSGTNTGDQFTGETVSTLIGRGSAAGAGAAQEITLGTNLSMSGTTLNAASGGGGTLQNVYDAVSGNTILTTDARNIALTLANVTTPTSFTIENQDTAGTSAQRIFNSIASGTLTNGLLIEQTGAGAMTNGVQILGTAGTTNAGLLIADGGGATANGIQMTGTFTTTLLDTPSIDISGAGAITGATGVSSTTGSFSSALAANGGITLDNSTDTIGAFTAGGTIAMGAQALTGTTGVINYTGFDVDASGNLDALGTLTAGSGNVQVTDAAGKVQHDSVVDCADGQILKWATAGGWGCAADATGGGGSTIVEKDADQTKSSNATMADDNTLVFTASANTAYYVQVRAAWTSNTTAEFKYTMTVPSGTIRASGRTFDSAALTGAIGENCNIDASGDVCTIAGTVTNTPILEINAIVAVNGTGGTVAFRWAQNASTATNTTVFKNSFLEYRALAGTADLAEVYYTNQPDIGPGDIVSIDPDLTKGVKKSEGSYDRNIFGIVSTDPALLIGDAGEGGVPVPIALSGRVPVKITTENGPIEIGDLLTSSSTPGVSMKATKAGQIVGQAMESFDGEGVGLVLAFVKTDYTNGSSLADIISESNDVDILNADIGKTALIKFISQKEQLAQKVDFSEIITDRVAAGLEIITPKVTAETVALNKIEAATGLDINFNLADGGALKINNANGENGITFDGNGNAIFQGTLTADAIVANKILGLEVYANQLSGIDESVAGLSSKLDGLEAAAEEAIDLSALGILEKKGALVIVREATFKEATVFEKMVTLLGNAVFKGVVSFEKVPTFNQDTAGYAIIKENADRVEVAFNQEYATTPVVNASLSLQYIEDDEVREAAGELLLVANANFIITNVTTKGFEIRINKKTISDIPFSWQALAVKDARTFESKSVSSHKDKGNENDNRENISQPIGAVPPVQENDRSIVPALREEITANENIVINSNEEVSSAAVSSTEAVSSAGSVIN